MAGQAISPRTGVPMPTGKKFTAGHDPRRSLGALTLAERAFKEVLEVKHIPKADALLTKVYAAALKRIGSGDTRPAELFFKICGLIKKPSNDEEVRRMVQIMFDEAIAEARRQRGEAEATPRKVIDAGIGTEE